MPDLSTFSLVDLIVLVLVVLAAVGALRRRSGILGAAGAAVGTLVVAWLAVVALGAWGPEPVAQAAGESRLVQTVPAPQQAIDEIDGLFGGSDADQPTAPAA
ncbi:hypothetical protein [Solicola sp. PLA-1-18]|uniref:hypothetical protein n=1 Tax=Solicola sp. PLA-1-18 TaxID=3380532 RepID=UPI003B77C60C